MWNYEWTETEIPTNLPNLGIDALMEAKGPDGRKVYRYVTENFEQTRHLARHGHMPINDIETVNPQLKKIKGMIAGAFVHLRGTNQIAAVNKSYKLIFGKGAPPSMKKQERIDRIIEQCMVSADAWKIVESVLKEKSDAADISSQYTGIEDPAPNPG